MLVNEYKLLRFNRQLQFLVYAYRGGWEVRHHIAGYAEEIKMVAM
jgi:hypothetical protein